MNVNQIDRITNLTPEAFTRDFLSRGRPVIVADEPALRAAARTWSLDYLASRHPHREVPIEYYPTGDRDRAWTYVEMKLAAYVDLLRSEPSARARYYLAEMPLAEIFPNTASELAIPAIIAKRKVARVVVFAGFDTFTAAHYHTTPKEAVLCQVFGKKNLVLYAPEEIRLLRPHPWWSIRSTFSKLPARGPMGEPETAARGYACTLEAGEMLFIPQGWFHVARGLGESVSVTYFFKGSWRHARRAVAARDFASLVERRLVIFPLMLLTRGTRFIDTLLRIGAALGVVPKTDREAWSSRFRQKENPKA